MNLSIRSRRALAVGFSLALAAAASGQIRGPMGEVPTGKPITIPTVPTTGAWDPQRNTQGLQNTFQSSPALQLGDRPSVGANDSAPSGDEDADAVRLAAARAERVRDETAQAARELWSFAHQSSKSLPILQKIRRVATP